MNWWIEAICACEGRREDEDNMESDEPGSAAAALISMANRFQIFELSINKHSLAQIYRLNFG